jgi:hypothetical protein
MPTWVLRKTVDGERVGDPLPCSSGNGLARVLGLLTLEEQMAYLLREEEAASEEVAGQRKIYRGQELVGYIVVLSTE